MAEEFSSLNHNSQSKECDLVMKGGITSGIVYPPLVLQLHKAGYRFRNIGGTSAGAIAAAITAAAAYGHGWKKESFKKLQSINEQFSGPGFIKKLFQPTAETASLYHTLFDLYDFSKRNKERLAKQSAPKKVYTYASHLAKILPETSKATFEAGQRLGICFAIGIGVGLAVVSSSIYLLVATLMINWESALRLGVIGFVLLSMLFFVLLVWPCRKIGGLVKSLYDLYLTLTQKVCANFFGICTGRTDIGTFDPTVLTDWLSVQLDDLAGLHDPVALKGNTQTPLTFGHLWQRPDSEKEQSDKEQHDDVNKERWIDLQMVASNLSQNQPYVLPLKENLFLFKRTDFDKLFPGYVVEHMVKNARPYRGFHLPGAINGNMSSEYYFLPEATDTPVIVVTRMSLSFPLLISMVPLYTISRDAFEEEVQFTIGDIELQSTDGRKKGIILKRRDGAGQWHEPELSGWKTLDTNHLQCNWFSDGGICSNFPIHFFDSWLPTRPTFGVNLTSQLANASSDQPEEKRKAVRHRSCQTAQYANGEPQSNHLRASEHTDVYLPQPEEVAAPEWIPISQLSEFLITIFHTAQNYRDNMQAMLPSYRERIVQIRLTDDEGGLNLDMLPKDIENVLRKGGEAGEALCDFNLEHHQWVRFRVLMKQMEASLTEMNLVMSTHQIYQDLVLKGEKFDLSDYPYMCDSDWLKSAAARLVTMGKLVRGFRPPDLFLSAKNPPVPEPKLRVTPEF